jgi:hypothetical protein
MILPTDRRTALRSTCRVLQMGRVRSERARRWAPPVGQGKAAPAALPDMQAGRQPRRGRPAEEAGGKRGKEHGTTHVFASFWPGDLRRALRGTGSPCGRRKRLPGATVLAGYPSAGSSLYRDPAAALARKHQRVRPGDRHIGRPRLPLGEGSDDRPGDPGRVIQRRHRQSAPLARSSERQRPTPETGTLSSGRKE